MASGRLIGGGITYWGNLVIDWTSTANTAGNKSTVTATLKLAMQSGGTISVNARAGTTITINGNTKTFQAPAVSKLNSSVVNITLGSHTVDVAHNEDGSKSINIGGYYPIQATIGTYYSGFSVTSTSVTLDRIYRNFYVRVGNGSNKPVIGEVYVGNSSNKPVKAQEVYVGNSSNKPVKAVY